MLARIATSEERCRDSDIGPAGQLEETVFEYDVKDEKQAEFAYDMLTTRDCAADRVSVWPN